jgi:hypothetical protein
MPIVSTGQITISDLNDGLNAYLTQEACLISTAQDGTGGVYTIANTTMVVRQGTADVSTQWTVTASAGSGVTGTLTTRTYQVTAMTVDTGYVDLTASKSGETPITLRFTITKAKQGITGTRGTIATSAATAGTVWSNSEADAAIAAAGGGTPIPGDVVTLYNSGASFSQTRVRNSLGNWALLAAFFGGDVLVDGTLGAQKIAANTITANQMAAGSITTVAIAAGAVSASKLVVSDFTNLCHSPNFADAFAWAMASQFTRVVAPSTSWKSSHVLRAVDVAGTARYATSKVFETDPGGSYYVEAQGYVVSGGASMYFYMQFSDDVTFATGITNTTFIYFSTTTLETKSTVLTAPTTGARYARMVLTKHANTTEGYIGSPLIRRAASGELIVDGSVVASKIAASAISADKIAAGSILASKLAVGDTSNIFPDPDMLDASLYTMPSGGSWSLNTNSYGSSKNYLFIGAANGTVEQYVLGPAFPVDEGLEYQIASKMGIQGSAPVATARLRINWYADNDASTTLISSTEIRSEIVTGGRTTRETVILTAPATARRARLRFYREAHATATTNAVFNEIVIRRAAAGELIVDGSILASHVGTNEIIANTANIANGVITTAKIVSLDANKINVGALNAGITVGATGVSIGTVESRAADPAARVNANSTLIAPGKVQITGSTALSSWINGGDATKIEGGAIAANTVAANAMQIGMRNIKVDSIAFEANTPSTNSVSWTNGQINYVNDAGTATAVSISAGNAAWTTGRLYIYWVKGATTLSSTTTGATAMGANNVVLAVYVGGLNLTTDIGRTIIDGSGIKTGSVTADRMVTNVFQTTGMGIFGGNLQSSNYSAGSAGWKINNSGSAEFNGVVTSRNMVVNSGSFTYTSSLAAGGSVVLPFVNTGIKIGTDDVWQVANVALLATVRVVPASASGVSNASLWRAKGDVYNAFKWYGASTWGSSHGFTYAWSEDPGTTVTPSWASGSDQRVMMDIELRNLSITMNANMTIYWKVYQVT